MPSTSGFERYSDLPKFRDYLLSNIAEERIDCFYRYRNGRTCSYDCRNYQEDHPRRFGAASENLRRGIDQIQSEDFIGIVRTFFCQSHDLLQKEDNHQVYKRHFEMLWKGATIELRSDVWNALRNSGRGIDLPSTPQRARPGRPKQIKSEPVDVNKRFLNALRDSSSPSSKHDPSLDPDNSTPSRPRVAHAKSDFNAESKVSKAEKTPSLDTETPDHVPATKDFLPALSSDSPSRPRVAQAKSDFNAESKVSKAEEAPSQDTETPDHVPTTKDFLPALSSDSPSRPRTAQVNFDPVTKLPVDEIAENLSALALKKEPSPDTPPFPPQTESLETKPKKATIDDLFSSVHQDDPTRLEENPFWKWNHDASRQEPRFPVIKSSQTIFERLEAGPMPEKLDDTGTPREVNSTRTAESSEKQATLTSVFESSSSEPLAMKVPTISHDLRRHQATSVSQERSSMALGHDKNHTAAGSPTPRANGSSESLKASTKLVDVDSPSISAKQSAPRTPSDKHAGRDISPHGKNITPKPCVYRPLLTTVIAANISKLLQKNITEERRGTIYVLEAPEFFSSFPPASSRGEQWVKIGISTDVIKRMDTLRARCGITDITAIYSSDPNTIRMDLLRRIEQVCHAQLNNYRRRMDCKSAGITKGCRTVHGEWFAVDKEVAKRTVTMWRRFLAYEPYGELGVLDDAWKKKLIDSENYKFEAKYGETEHDLFQRQFEAFIEGVNVERKESEDLKESVCANKKN
ncbi:hypothetical protein N0V90_012990 [Kalmusia sp. IMI 367209]|nr:hypothetical protein N0V90_012990 [Kalmusia sp. IMI 367209]